MHKAASFEGQLVHRAVNLNPMFLEALDKKLVFKGAKLAYLGNCFKGLIPFQQALFISYLNENATAPKNCLVVLVFQLFKPLAFLGKLHFPRVV